MIRIGSAAEMQHDTPGISLSAWESRHLLMTWFAATFAVVAAFWNIAEAWTLPAGIYIVLCGGALLIARAMRIIIFDTLLQFQYKERFGLFVFHLMVLALPSMIGLGGWNHGLAALMVLLCFQAVNKLAMGRIYAVTILMGIMSVTSTPLPPFWATAGWMLCLLLAMRFEHVRFRLERHAKYQAVPAGDALRETLQGAVVPWIAGLVVYGGFYLLLRGKTRQLVFERGVVRGGPSSDVGAVSVSEVLFDGMVLVGLIIGVLLLLNWLEKKLRGRQKATTGMGEAHLDVTEEHAGLAPEMTFEHVEEGARDARGRILAGFRRFANGLAALGYGRPEQETPREYLSRLQCDLARDSLPGDPMAKAVNRACYSDEDITEEEARDFLGGIEELEPRLRREIAARAAKVDRE